MLLGATWSAFLAALILQAEDDGVSLFLLCVSFLGLFIVTLKVSLSDIRSLRIRNIYSFLLMLLFAMAYGSAPQVFFPLWHHIGGFTLTFCLTLVLYAVGVFGGADTKIASVLALWVGLQGLMVFFFYMALFGGVLGGISLWVRKKKPFQNPVSGSWIDQLQQGRNAVPYGVALSIAVWTALFHIGVIHHVLSEVFKIIH